MQEASSRYVHAIALARQRNGKHLRFAALVAVLIAALLWRTQWLSLRSGLIVLLLGQIGAAMMLFRRGATLKKNLEAARNDTEFNALAWFAAEGAFVRSLDTFENSLRVIGFALLAYGFWNATRSLWLALVIGVIYPVTAYFGIGRANTRRTLRELEAQKNKL
jgi:hypothetical protein